jgi:hypothetical protein
MKVVAAVGELEREYADEMDFHIIPAAETALAAAEIESFGFTALRHGLVTFSASGEAVGKLPGHDYGRTEIVEAIEAALAQD